MNETLDAFDKFMIYLNATGGKIPLEVTSTVSTNSSQFYTSVAITLLSSIFVLYFLWGSVKPTISHFIVRHALNRIKKKTGRNILFIKHTMQGLFGGSMIDSKTMMDLNKALSKFEGKPFDLVLHTPGGEIFSSMFISRVLRQYPADINVLVPFYAMSGGTLLALSGKQIYMSPTACLGPVDPQLGSLFKFGSAKAWDQIVKKKGNKAEDQTHSFAFMGAQYTKSIAAYIHSLLNGKMEPGAQNTFVDFLTDGGVEHAYPLTIQELQRFGLRVVPLGQEVTQALSGIITSPLYEGVYSV